MTKMSISDLEKQLGKTLKNKVDAMVAARKAEFWIRDNKEEYYKVVRNYNGSRKRLKNIIAIRKLPFYIHVIANIRLFLSHPIYYFTQHFTFRKVIIESYWAFKKIKKEWEDDFDQTEKLIEEDYKSAKEFDANIKLLKQLIKKEENA
jgi:hypothetical protein